MEYVRSRRVSLKAHPKFNEKWLQQQITADSTLLGLGDLDVKDVERRQPRAGRLDVLLFDADTNTRYEVEIQLGPTDESHIIRTPGVLGQRAATIPPVRARSCHRG